MSLLIPPNQLQARSSEASLARIGTSSQQHLAVNFSSVGNPNGDFVARLTDAFNGTDNTIRVVLSWASMTTNVGAAKWDVSFERWEAGVHNLATDSFDTLQTVTGTVSGTTGVMVEHTIDFSLAEADDLAVDDKFRLRVERNTADVADTLVGDAMLVGIQFRYLFQA